MTILVFCALTTPSIPALGAALSGTCLIVLQGLSRCPSTTRRESTPMAEMTPLAGLYGKENWQLP